MKKIFLKILSVFSFMCMFMFNVNANEVDDADVDAVFLYIDVNDPELQKKRPDLKNCIKKDCENDELKYALRSVLKNIPWIRKIFIVMPNEKVKFLKNQDEINDKIAYINDEEIIEGGTRACCTKQWNLWKLKEKLCSDNVILFDDDYFIGQPLKKSDFFYKNDKDKIVPYIFYDGKISQISKEKITQKLKNIKKKVKEDNMKKQDSLSFWHQIFSGREFLYSALNKDKILNSVNHCFPHNAISLNLSELKSLYNVVKKQYPDWKDCLEAKTRELNAFVFQDFYNFYYLNADNRKINKKIKYKYFDLADKNIVNAVKKNKYDLFCINTGGGREYTDEERLRARKAMNELFPDKTKYEKEEVKISKAA